MDAVAEIKGRLGIEDVVGEYVRLKRAGKNYKGLSPFTNEKTPSFVVSPEKQIWHDFSSGRGGDMFTFIQEVEGVDFKGALEQLARKAGVDLEQYNKTRQGKGIDKERLLQANELATKFYQSQLKINQAALEYLIKKRVFNKQTLLEFKLGYSPNNARSLTDFLIKKGFSEKELLLAGLSVNRRGVVGDMFRGRIMVPLCDSFGKVVGFTARLLHDDPNAPKYINTSSTPLYDKSRHIFGLHLAKQAIRQHKYSVLVEGNMDVVASHQAGQKQVVATAGTALTEQQLKTLARFSDDVRLAFDADRAGGEAAERAIPIASKTGVNLGIITIPSGKDPDELIQKDPKLWEGAINNSQYAMDWLIDRYKDQLDLTSARGKREFSDIIFRILSGLNDPVEQEHYLKTLADLLGTDMSALRKKLANNTEGTSPRLKAAKPTNLSSVDVELKRTIDHLLCLALMMPGTRGYLEHVKSEMLLNSEQKQIYEFLQKNPDFSGQLTDTHELLEVADYVKMLVLQFEELYGAVDTLELQYEAARLRARTIEYYVRNQKKLLSDELTNSDAQQQRKALAQVKELNELLKVVKES